MKRLFWLPFLAAMALPIAVMAGERGVKTSAAPLAYQLFCLKNPQECKAGRNNQVEHSAALMQTLTTVNNAVNRSLRFVSEQSDDWKATGSAGDCEDFALAKRQRLVRLGVPAGALRVAMVRTRKGEGHAVLVVRTSKGDLVLDNARPSIVRREQAGYRWISMATSDPGRWTKL